VNRRFPFCVAGVAAPNINRTVFFIKLELQIRILLKLKGGKEQAQLVRPAVYSSVQGAPQSWTILLTYMLAHPLKLVNPLDGRQIWVVFWLINRVGRRCVTVMTSLCSSKSTDELVPFAVWFGAGRQEDDYSRYRLSEQPTESSPSPAESHWTSVACSESCRPCGPGCPWKWTTIQRTAESPLRGAPRPTWLRLAASAVNAHDRVNGNALSKCPAPCPRALSACEFW